MSNSILTLYPGLAFSVKKKPGWNTNVADAMSGRQFTLRRRVYPTWEFSLPFEVLRARASFAEMQAIVGFYNARGGRFDDWLFMDPRENALVAQLFGTGDGVTKTFELVKSLGSFVEPVGAVNPATLVIKVAGTPTVAYSLDSQQRSVTFTVAPTVGQALTADGTFYYRVRFLNDTLDLEEFMYDKWKTELRFRSFRP